MAIDMRKQARASVAIESIPDDAIEAAQDAFHEFVLGPDEPLTKRDKGITRLAYRVAIHAALEAMAFAARPELQHVIQQWDDNGDDPFGKFDNLVDALICAYPQVFLIQTGGSDD